MRLRRAVFLAIALALVIAAAAVYRQRMGPTDADRSNVILISLCSVRADHMSFYGYVRDTTPNLGALAKESIVFDNAITQWPKTAPAFAAIVTGKYGHTTGVTRITPRQHLGNEHETLAEVLSSHGYETGAFISTPALNVNTNILQGFDRINETWRDRGSQSYREATRSAVEWLKQRKKGTPFFAWVHYNNAHNPYRAPDAPPGLFVDDAHYDPRRSVKLNPPDGLDLDIPADNPYRHQILRPDIGGVDPRIVLRKRPRELDYYIARYDAGIYGADHVAGNLLDAVRRLGLMENTIIVVVGDHGESLGEHNYFFEHGRFPYDDCARVPLLIRALDGKAMRVSAPVASFGLAPTVLEMLGIEAPAAMEAKSLLPVVRGEREGYVFTESGYALDYTLAVRNSKWKLIHVPDPVDRSLMTGAEYELYSYGTDTEELHNLYDTETGEATRLRQVLDEWSKPWIEKAYHPAPPQKDSVDDATRERLRSLGYTP